MKTYSKEFEDWWEQQGKYICIDAPTDQCKALAWQAWRVGREHLSEELSHLRLQPIRS